MRLGQDGMQHTYMAPSDMKASLSRQLLSLSISFSFPAPNFRSQPYMVTLSFDNTVSSNSSSARFRAARHSALILARRHNATTIILSSPCQIRGLSLLSGLMRISALFSWLIKERRRPGLPLASVLCGMYPITTCPFTKMIDFLVSVERIQLQFGIISVENRHSSHKISRKYALESKQT